MRVPHSGHAKAAALVPEMSIPQETQVRECVDAESLSLIPLPVYPRVKSCRKSLAASNRELVEDLLDGDFDTADDRLVVFDVGLFASLPEVRESSVPLPLVSKAACDEGPVPLELVVEVRTGMSE